MSSRLVLEERALRDPVGSEVLLRVRAAGVCGTDLKLFRGKNPRLKLPLVLGHEFAGEVAAVGPEVRLRRVGERAVVYMYMTCGQCEPCLTGRENLCANRRGFFGFDRDGGFAEYVLVPEAEPGALSRYRLVRRGSHPWRCGCDKLARRAHPGKSQTCPNPCCGGAGRIRSSCGPMWVRLWSRGHCGRFG